MYALLDSFVRSIATKITLASTRKTLWRKASTRHVRSLATATKSSGAVNVLVIGRTEGLVHATYD